MNKLKSSIIFSLISIISMAQSRPAGRENNPDTFGTGDAGGQFGAPIDNYTIALIFAAVFIIAYVVYTKRQSKLA